MEIGNKIILKGISGTIIGKTYNSGRNQFRYEVEPEDVSENSFFCWDEQIASTETTNLNIEQTESGFELTVNQDGSDRVYQFPDWMETSFFIYNLVKTGSRFKNGKIIR
jgi:hypothetical protein